MDMSERGAALLAILIICMLCGPIYLGLLIIGYALRKKLVLTPLLMWLFVASFPVAIFSFIFLRFFGGEGINTSSTLGTVAGVCAFVALCSGILAAIAIVAQSLWTAKRKRKDTTV